MDRDKVLRYAKRKYDEGYSKQEIRNTLIMKGVPMELATDVVNGIESGGSGKKAAIIIVIVAVAAIFSIYYFFLPKAPPITSEIIHPFCGDGYCDLNESCTDCDDCACSPGFECYENSGICLEAQECGDGYCEGSENYESCCIDCGCINGKKCDVYFNFCKDVPTASNETIISLSNDYMINNGLDPENADFRIYDSYYMEQFVKGVLISYPCDDNSCLLSIYISPNNEVIEPVD